MAEVLDGLRESGYKVFHDILGEGFNLDHVLIGPTGVYTVETKTYTKPARGPAVVKFDGERITINGYEPDRNAIVQAKAQAQWLSRLLGEVTGRRVQVRPTVVYPGWHIDEVPKSQGEVWVLGTYGLKSFLPNEPNRLTREEVVALANQLSRAVRPSDRP